MNNENSEDGWLDFLEICGMLKDPQKFDKFFSLFLTIEERKVLTSRYLIIKALLEGKLTQREIAETYKVSIAQITRGSNALKIVDPNFRSFLESKLK